MIQLDERLTKRFPRSVLTEAGGQTTWHTGDGRRFAVTEANREELLRLLEEPLPKVRVVGIGEWRKRLMKEAQID